MITSVDPKSAAGQLARRLGAAALSGPRREGDRLVLGDAVLRAALDGSAPLSAAAATALAASPLTLRRFQVLADARRAASAWSHSAGMLRAADSGAVLEQLATDDGHWTLHFIDAGAGWQVVLKLDAGAPFAAQLLRQAAAGALLEVRDGAGAVVLQGALDRDGECEQAWPCAAAPSAHFQSHGARFSVALATPA